MEIVSNVALISINETLIAQGISFLIFLFLFNRIMIRPLQATMRERTRYVQTIENSIRESNDNLQSLQRKLENEERTAIQKASAEQEKLEKAGSSEAEQILEEYRKEISDIRNRNQKEIEQQITEARKSLKKESEQLALRIMEKILDREVSRA